MCSTGPQQVISLHLFVQIRGFAVYLALDIIRGGATIHQGMVRSTDVNENMKTIVSSAQPLAGGAYLMGCSSSGVLVVIIVVLVVRQVFIQMPSSPKYLLDLPQT